MKSMQTPAAETRLGSNRISTRKLVTMAMLIAIGVALVAVFHYPIIPAVPFLLYDAADVPIFIGAFAFGPWWGIAMTAIISVIQGTLISPADGIVGILMHILATGSFVLVSGLFYRRKKTRQRAIASLALGTGVWILVMIGWNLVITPAYFQMPLSAVVALLPWIILFNFIKAGANSILTYFLYKPIHHLIEKFEK